MKRGCRRVRSNTATLVSVLMLGCSDDSGSAVPTPGVGGFGFPDEPSTTSGPEIVPQNIALWGEVTNNPARPMVAGTLTVTPDGALALASDSERDVIYVVDLAGRKPRRIALEAGDEPGRIVSGRSKDFVPHAYAVLRRSNAVVDIDLHNDAFERIPTCNAPRGVAYDDDTQRAHVVCANGELVTYDVEDWSEKRRVFVAPDSRDVAVVENGLVVSRYASAEVLVVNDDGDVQSRAKPDAPQCTEATVAHRLAVQGDDVYVVHQLASNGLNHEPGTRDCSGPDVVSLLTKEPLAQFSQPSPVWQAVSQLDPIEGSKLTLGDAQAPFAARFSWSSGPLDFALGSDGRVVVSLAGNYWVDELATIVTLEPPAQDGVEWSRRARAFRPAGNVTSVAIDNAGKWIALSREPAALYFEDQTPIFLGGRSVNNAGFSLLHMNTGSGVACVSCHPEGERDDHIWRFAYGARATLPLRGARAPFNWSHSVADMSQLITEVLYGQMQYSLSVTSEQASVLQSWLAELPVTDTSVVLPPAAVRGEALFESADVGCATCHQGKTFTDKLAHDVDTGGTFATPSLVGVALRGSLLHDGCAATLEAVFGMCGGSHQSVQNLKREEVEDLLAFLESL